MGNVLSGDEKFAHFFSSYDKKSRGIVWIDEQFGYQPADKNKKKEFVEKRARYYNGQKRRISRQRSHSLGAIIEDLYFAEENLGGSYHGLSSHNHIRLSNSYIPRIKLAKDMPIKDNFQYSSNLEICESPPDIQLKDTLKSTYNERFILNEKKDEKTAARCYSGDDFSCEISNKHEENYFTKNFDDCMKRLEIIEKEQDKMENEGGRKLNTYNMKKPLKRQMTPLSEEYIIPPPEQEAETSAHECRELPTSEKQLQGSSLIQVANGNEDNPENGETIQNEESQTSPPSKETKTDVADSLRNDTSKSTAGWYSKLQKQFGNDKQDMRTKEAPCRVTGATLKIATPAQSSESDSKEVRHYFSRLVRSNKSLIDEELPDPDKVQNIRAMFQESLNSTLKKNFGRLGGSLQNINVRHSEDQSTRPKSAQGSRNEFDAEFSRAGREGYCSSTGTPVTAAGVHLGRNVKGNIRNEMETNKITDSQTTKYANRKYLQLKWTDTTSLSSGVSSDLSSYDTDAECCSRDDIEVSTTDEELHDENDDKHYVQNETLEKIRSFGTSVTYFGGQMIRCSVGPLLSPTTQAILDETGEKDSERRNITRTFEEFYRKYTENNELRRKKLGRTRSFGQTDVFQRPNTLYNTEIEMYKNDLEHEIGIRKPSGKSQNTLKLKLVKSVSVGGRLELFEKEVVEKLNEILEAAVEMARSEKQEGNEEENTASNDIAKEDPFLDDVKIDFKKGDDGETPDTLPIKRAPTTDILAQEVTMRKASIREASVGKLSIADTPIVEIPEGKISIEEIPALEALTKKSSTEEEAPAKKSSSEEAPAVEILTQKTDVKEVLTGEERSRKTSLEEIFARNVMQENTQVAEILARKDSMEEVPAVKVSVRKVSAEEIPTVEVVAGKLSQGEKLSKEVDSQTQSKELLFGYEKTIFDNKRGPDMEFEEYEVCETVSEKMGKLEENPQSYRLTIQVNQATPTEEGKFEEIVINEQEPLDSLEIYLKKNRVTEGSVESNDNNPSNDSRSSTIDNDRLLNKKFSDSRKLFGKQLVEDSKIEGESKILPHSHITQHRYGSSKWPIETTVMIDIQKNDEHTPKLVTTGKSTVKTKTRSFKR